MVTTYPQDNMPVPWNSGGSTMHGEDTWVTTIGTDTHANAIFPECWVKQSTTGFIAVPSSFTAADYRVLRIRNRQHQQKNLQYVDTTTLNVDANVFELEVEPLGGQIFAITEDALATPISDNATTGWPTLKYTVVLVTEPSDPSNNAAPTAAARGKYLLDSSAITSTATSQSVQIIGVAPIAGNPAYSATASAAPRVFLCKAYNPGHSL